MDEEAPKKVAEVRYPYGEQDAWGNSVDALRANLKLTPIERLRKAQRAANSISRLKRAIKRVS